MASGRNPVYSRVLGVIAVAGLLVLVASAPSLARPAQNLNAKVKALATGLSEFSGRVTATNPDCVKGRKVKISTRSKLLGKAKTDKEGRFFIQRKSVKTGTKITFELKARGEACIPLTASLEAP
jgi:hypothetical protein